ncbi:MAG: cation-translocating P-type ATPase [Nitrospirae bacterium]|nr:cation-translocating P-type ATPase [Nitrospirota bacterium]
MNNAWHTLSSQEALERLGTSSEGLPEAKAWRRLAEHGPNELKEELRATPFSLFLAQFKNLLLVILLVAVALSAFMGHVVEAVAIAVILLLAVLLGFIQEYRAERAIEALRALAAPTAHVLRDGGELEIPARELVPGDILILRTGDKVPADARLIESVNLQTMEAALTGESLPVEKDLAAIPSTEAPLGDRRNMVYMGTAVSYGRGKAVVVQTGMGTEFGQIAGMLQTVEREKTPLQKELDRVGKRLVQAGLAVVALIVGAGLLRGGEFLEMLVWGIALAVAVVPEALPAVVTISLALGVRRMVRRHALIRRLPAVETLGCTSVIASDKTGTLTKDEMTVRRLFVAGTAFEVTGSGYAPEGEFLQEGQRVGPKDATWVSISRLLRAATLCSDARLRPFEGKWEILGDPTEGALLVAASKSGIDIESAEGEAPRIREVPFSSERKRMTTIHRESEGVFAYSKGAPEVILASCAQWLGPSGEAPLGPKEREAILKVAREMAARALRVLAVASRSIPEGVAYEESEREMVFLGLFGLYDPPREEVPEAIRKCEAAGILPVRIPGDHRETAEAVAREIGLLNPHVAPSPRSSPTRGEEGEKASALSRTEWGEGRVITGAELDAMDPGEHARRVEEIRVYARVSPAHKLRVVEAFQSLGHVVAMTGDGVNDAPALKKADIGIAMGITGTDVSKEAAAMTLTDDNFASIVAAVEEGRGIYGNIKKYLMYLLSSNIGEIVLMAVATLLGFPLPLSAVQILYVNLATDGLPALALAFDPPEKDLMQRPPRDPRRSLFTAPVVGLMLIGGAWSAITNLAVFSWVLASGRGIGAAMGMVFAALILIELFKAYNFRSDRYSLFTGGAFANPWLNLAIAWELLLLAAVVSVSVLQGIFLTADLTASDLALALAAAATIFPALELGKLAVRRGWMGRVD